LSNLTIKISHCIYINLYLENENILLYVALKRGITLKNNINLNQITDNLVPQVKAAFEKLLTSKSSESFQPPSPDKLPSYIDHTLLRADARTDEIIKLCHEAKEFKFKTVCINSSFVPLAAKELKGTAVLPITVVGFPLGAMSTESKVFEAENAIKNGAKEIDMVINIGLLKSKEYETVFNDIRKIAEAAKPYPLKVIIETALLSDEEKIIASILSQEAGAEFVKTSTGFAPSGAKENDLKLIRLAIGNKTKIKASGGIKTYSDAMKMIAAGADRIGSSASVSILKEALAKRS
jgi:deoxyribose-phosphate aldolase